MAADPRPLNSKAASAGQSADDQPASPFKSQAGLTRIVRAARYSWQGLQLAWQHEHAFRQELLLAAVAIPAACLMPVSLTMRAVLVMAMLLVLIVEILNSALEAVVDWISVAPHPMAGRAKDLGSAAVMLALLNWGCCWAFALWTWWQPS